MVDLLFGQSYYLRFDPKLWQAMQPLPPLGSLYAASYLRSKGYQVGFFDSMLAESEAEWAQAVEKHKPRLAVLFEDNFNYLSKMCLLRMRQAAFKMIEFAREQGCTVITCGADASDNPELYLEQGADFVVQGEGEITLGELVDVLFGRLHIPLEQIQGLAYLVASEDAGKAEPAGGARRLVRTPRRDDLRDLDALPFPAWDLVDLSRYRTIWKAKHGYFAINMATTRGCPFHCNWCAKPIWGQRYNVRSPENVVAEMKQLILTCQPDMIWFVDDIFGLKPGWLARFAELLMVEGIKVPFKCLERVDLLLRDGEIEALREAGASIVWVGAESGSQKILDAMEKGTRLEQIYQAAARLRKAGIQVGFFLQFGYPGETRQDIEKTLRMVRECKPDDIGMSVAYPLPGTQFYRRVKEQLGVQQNWYDSDDLAMLYKGPFTTEFYRQLHRVLHGEFRMRRAWDEIRQRRGDTDPGVSTARNRKVLKASGLLIYHAMRLPLERARMEWLGRQTSNSTIMLTHTLTADEAASPTPQLD